jgi:chemotaxis protein histidine kinase CheA
MAQPQAAPERISRAVHEDVVKQLRSLEEAGENSFFANLVQEFAAEGARLLAAIHLAVESGNSIALRNAAHSLKGSAASMGAACLAALCKDDPDVWKGGRDTFRPRLASQAAAGVGAGSGRLRRYLRE